MRLNRLPFGVQLVVLFFALDGVEKVVALGQAVMMLGPEVTKRAFVDDLFPLILALLFDLLLFVMLLLRTRAGRFWGMIYLLALTGVGITLLIREPLRWLEMGAEGRIREVASYGVNTLLAAILYGRRAREALRN